MANNIHKDDLYQRVEYTACNASLNILCKKGTTLSLVSNVALTI